MNPGRQRTGEASISVVIPCYRCGDTIKRGQTIAKAGQTGTVTSPQVHFEIRKGSAPVDPTQYLNGA